MRCLLKLLKPRPLKSRILIGVEVVKADHWCPALEKAIGQMEADETGGSSDQHGLLQGCHPVKDRCSGTIKWRTADSIHNASMALQIAAG